MPKTSGLSPFQAGLVMVLLENCQKALKMAQFGPKMGHKRHVFLKKVTQDAQTNEFSPFLRLF